MNLQSYTIIHYGKAYLLEAIEQVLPFVDLAHIIYTPTPSHGHSTLARNPDTKEDIHKEIGSIRTNKFRVYEAEFSQEGQQRDWAVDLCKRNGADVVLVVDYDEIWPGKTLLWMMQRIKGDLGGARNWLVNMTHMWRSFNHVCRDNGWPVRFIDLTADNNDTRYMDRELGEVYHFGYAVTDDIMRYKWSIHGHKNDLRPNWFEEKWHNWQPGITDVHPTNDKDFWTPEPFDKILLPEVMRVHPYFNLDRVE